jgi:hypothetical protein
MKKLKKFLLTITVVSSICLSSINVFAADYLSYGWPTAAVPIKTYDYNSVWQSPMDTSISSWNNASAKITFNKVSSSSHSVTAAQFEYTDYGRNYATYSGSKLTDFRIELNARTISADATNFSNFVQSVFVHELGHSIWLDDNPPTTNSSIMLYARDRNTLTTPSWYDRTNVSAKY